MWYRIERFYADKITMTPTIPINGLTENGAEDNKTPRLCFADSITGCLAAQGTTIFDNTYIVYVPKNPKIKVRKPTKKQCPDAHITGEVWYTGKPIELVPIGTVYTGNESIEVGKYAPYGKKGKTVPIYSCGYTFEPFKSVKIKQT